MNKCEKNCKECSFLNTKTDKKGYPFGYDCLKYGNSVFPEDFHNTKEFNKKEVDDIIFLPYSKFQKVLDLHFENPDLVPEYLYATRYEGSGNWIGADNRYGQLFVEEFADKTDCVKWLLDETIYAPELPSYAGLFKEEEE